MFWPFGYQTCSITECLSFKYWTSQVFWCLVYIWGMLYKIPEARVDPCWRLRMSWGHWGWSRKEIRHSQKMLRCRERKRQQERSATKTSNNIIAGNGRLLKCYMFYVWLYLFRKIYNVNDFFSFSFWCNLVLYLMVVGNNIIYVFSHPVPITYYIFAVSFDAVSKI